MGFESFRVELQGGSATYQEANATIRNLPHISPDQHSIPTHGSSYFLWRDGQHVVELELKDTPVRLSCRFTLCHAPSVDLAFLELVRELMARLGMSVRICDDVSPDHSQAFPLGACEGFASLARFYIARRRAEWIATFGTEQVSATTNEVYEQVILPRCRPLAPSSSR